MQEQARKIILIIGISLLFISIILFTYYRFAAYLNGPELISINISNYETTQTPWKKIEIQTKNTKSISVNNKNIPIEENFISRDIVVFHKNENIIKIVLTDKFNKEKIYTYHIYLKQNEQTKLPKNLKEAKKQLEAMEETLKILNQT